MTRIPGNGAPEEFPGVVDASAAAAVPPAGELSAFDSEPPIPASFNGTELTIKDHRRTVTAHEIRVLAALIDHPDTRFTAIGLTQAVVEVGGVKKALPSASVVLAAKRLAAFAQEAAGVEVIELRFMREGGRTPVSIKLLRAVTLADETPPNRRTDKILPGLCSATASRRRRSRRASAHSESFRETMIRVYDRVAAAGDGLETEGGPAEAEHELRVAEQVGMSRESAHELLLIQRVAAALNMPSHPDNFPGIDDMELYKTAAWAQVNVCLQSAHDAGVTEPGLLTLIALRLGMPPGRPELPVLDSLRVADSAGEPVTYEEACKACGGNRSFATLGRLVGRAPDAAAGMYAEAITALREHIATQ